MSNLITNKKNLSNSFDILDLFLYFSQFLTQNYLIVITQEINSFNFLLLPGSTGINLSHSFSKILTFISMENLILEIGPVILRLWFTINCYNNPFEYLMSFWFTIIDFYLFKSFCINFGSNLNSFLPLSKIFFLI